MSCRLGGVGKPPQWWKVPPRDSGAASFFGGVPLRRSASSVAITPWHATKKTPVIAVANQGGLRRVRRGNLDFLGCPIFPLLSFFPSCALRRATLWVLALPAARPCAFLLSSLFESVILLGAVPGRVCSPCPCTLSYRPTCVCVFGVRSVLSLPVVVAIPGPGCVLNRPRVPRCHPIPGASPLLPCSRPWGHPWLNTRVLRLLGL